MHVSDLGVLAELFPDLLEDALLVGDAPRILRLGWQVVRDVAVDQVLDGRRRAPLALGAGRVNTAIDFLAELLGLVAGGGRRSARPCANGVAPLDAVEMVIEEERFGAAGIDDEAKA